MTHKNLIVDTEIIIGDGVDFVMLTVSGAAGDTVDVSVMIGDTLQTETFILDEMGVATEQFTCDTPRTVITFSVDNNAEGDRPANTITRKVRVI